ncbi:ATP-binding protein [Actinomadura macra]|uniref:ATP-binding protein n=1 Tax=Actinomadura macra TaxID=46164 RepID=UPI00082E74C8|nr:AAA family ATPase [Actinomadura macra]
MESQLIGRETQTRVLRDLVARAGVSHGGLVLVCGEAGIGKTALAGRAVAEAARQGMRVLHGACWDGDGTPGYWPWAQALRGLRRGCTPEDWADLASAADGVLPVLLGEDSKSEDVPAFHLLDAVGTMMVTASRRRPVLVVLEDLHWADAASLGLLEFVAQHIWFERVLLVATYRDVEIERPDHPLRPLAARATTLYLTGLEPRGVRELLARTAGEQLPESLVKAVHARTGGNPFLVEETARLWSAGHPITTISPGVRAALHRRLSLLSEPVVRLLEAAAVLGQCFRPAVLARSTGVDEARVSHLLAEAADAHLVRPAGAEGLVFRHDLVRETLDESLGERERRRLHAAAVHALRDLTGPADPARPTELARHAYFAYDELDGRVAADLLADAARHAAGRLADQEAVAHYERALERLGDADPARSVQLSLLLGNELYLVGDRDRAWRAFGDAVTWARGLDDPTVLDQVALVLHGTDGRGDTTGLKEHLLREVYARPTATATGAAAATADDPAIMADHVARRVVTTGRERHDDEALHVGLWARLHACWGPETVAERAALSSELVEVSQRRGDRCGAHRAMSMRWVALLESGDPAYLDQFHTLVATAGDGGSPRMRLTSLIDRGVVYAVMGRFAEAEEAHAELVTSHARLTDRFQHYARHHRWALSLLQGRFAETDGIREALSARDHTHGELLAAITALEQGENPTGAAPRLGEGRPPHDRGLVPLWLRYQAQAAASADPAWCEQVRAALKPYRGRWLISFYGWDVSGPAALWTGLVDAAQDRWDDAVEEFTRAQRSADLLGARPWSVRARLELAAALSARGAGSDADTAEGLLREAAVEARLLGMAHLADRAERALPTPVPDSNAADLVNDFTTDGSIWRLGFAGRTVHMSDAKGLRDLHCLLGSPGRYVPAVRLLNARDPAVEASATMGADTVLDDEAKARYRRRLKRLDEEIDRAAGRGDDRRAAEFDHERQALLDELRRATGLAGRDRRLGDDGEHARKSVTARIRNTLRRIEERHPELGAHLRQTVTTGTTCRYAPDHEIRWRL